MPIIEVEETEFLSPIEGEDYIVVKTSMEEVTADFGTASVIRVALEPLDRAKNDNNIYNEGLWIPKEGRTTPQSKLGSFIRAFGDYNEANHEAMTERYGAKLNQKDSDQWEGAIVRVLSWEEKKRKLQVRKYAKAKTVETLQKELALRKGSS